MKRILGLALAGAAFAALAQEQDIQRALINSGSDNMATDNSQSCVQSGSSASIAFGGATGTLESRPSN